MRLALVLLMLGLSSGTSVKAEYFGSGWPILLAQFACSDNEICLTKLANCGPGAANCASGVSICDVSVPGEAPAPFECQSDRISDPTGRVVMVPRFHLEPASHEFSEGQDTLFFANDGFSTLNGHVAEVISPDCLHDLSTDVIYCASDIATQADAELWLKNHNN